MTYKKISEQKPEEGQLCLVQFHIIASPSVMRFVYLNESKVFCWDEAALSEYYEIHDDHYWMPCPIRSE